MEHLDNLMHSPGPENEGSIISPGNNQDQNISTETGGKEEKPIIEKIKEALQEWSNKDEADQEFDDTRV